MQYVASIFLSTRANEDAAVRRNARLKAIALLLVQPALLLLAFASGFSFQNWDAMSLIGVLLALFGPPIGLWYLARQARRHTIGKQVSKWAGLTYLAGSAYVVLGVFLIALVILLPLIYNAIYPFYPYAA